MSKSPSTDKDYENVPGDKANYVNMDEFTVLNDPEYVNMPNNSVPSDESAPPPPIRAVSIQQGLVGKK